MIKKGKLYSKYLILWLLIFFLILWFYFHCIKISISKIYLKTVSERDSSQIPRFWNHLVSSVTHEVIVEITVNTIPDRIKDQAMAELALYRILFVCYGDESQNRSCTSFYYQRVSSFYIYLYPDLLDYVVSGFILASSIGVADEGPSTQTFGKGLRRGRLFGLYSFLLVLFKVFL